MRIAVDAHTFCPDEMTGGDVYVLNLVREFAGMRGDDTFVILLNAVSAHRRQRASDRLLAAAREQLGAIAELRFDVAFSRLPSRLPEGLFNAWYYHVTVPRIAAAHDADVCFGTNYYCVTKGPWRKVVKIHDLAPLVCPEFTHPRMFKRFRRDMLRVTASADAVLTDTRSTQADIVRELGVDAERVVPIYEAPDPCYRPGDVATACHVLRERYDLGAPYFLFVGTVQPRKNVANLIVAFDRLKQRVSVPHHLILVGKLGWGYEAALRAREVAGAREAIHFVNYVPQEDLVHFYAAAEAFVWPSLYEGIGLPLLEAMACGAPVITSDRGSMRETAGDAALLADPDDPDDMAVCMERIVSDDELRASLRARGLERAAMFSWRATAEQTLAAIKGEGGAE